MLGYHKTANSWLSWYCLSYQVNVHTHCAIGYWSVAQPFIVTIFFIKSRGVEDAMCMYGHTRKAVNIRCYILPTNSESFNMHHHDLTSLWSPDTQRPPFWTSTWPAQSGLSAMERRHSPGVSSPSRHSLDSRCTGNMEVLEYFTGTYTLSYVTTPISCQYLWNIVRDGHRFCPGQRNQAWYFFGFFHLGFTMTNIVLTRKQELDAQLNLALLSKFSVQYY